MLAKVSPWKTQAQAGPEGPGRGMECSCQEFLARLEDRATLSLGAAARVFTGTRVQAGRASHCPCHGGIGMRDEAVSIFHPYIKVLLPVPGQHRLPKNKPLACVCLANPSALHMEKQMDSPLPSISPEVEHSYFTSYYLSLEPLLGRQKESHCRVPSVILLRRIGN